MLSMTEYVHQRMETYPKKTIGIDFTMGKGNDTVVLSRLCKEVYSFDIQEDALRETKKKIHDKKVHLILKSHEYFDDYIQSFDIGIFNLGYLPEYDHQITTQLQSTQIAIKKAIQYMNQVLFIVCYIGHEEGQKEAQWIDYYVSQLDTHQYNVSTYKMLNKHQSPYVIEIEKR